MDIGIGARRALAVVGLAVLVAVNGAAGAEPEPPPLIDKVVIDPATGEPTTAPEYGGVLVYVCETDPDYTVSIWDQGTRDCNLVSGVLEKPVVADWAIRGEQNLRVPYVPVTHMTGGLVQSWEWSEDSTELVLNLREGIYWHDKGPLDGREFTASDLAIFFENLFGVGGAGNCNAGVWCQLRVASVSHTTNPTVTLHLEQPSFFELGELLDSSHMFIYPPELLQQAQDPFDWRDLVGTGPLMLTSYIEGDSITWDRNPNYWGFDEKFPRNSLPYVDEVRALIIPDAQLRKAAFLTGQIDYLGIGGTFVQPDSVEDFERLGARSWDTWVASENSFGVNVNSDHLQVLNVRAALQMALDLETISGIVFDGRADWTPHGQIGYSLTDYYIPFYEWPDGIQERYRYDPDRAEQLLDDAGLPRGADGNRFETNLYIPTHLDLRYAEAAAEYWSAIGVSVDIELLDRQRFVEMRRQGPPYFDGLISATAAAQFFHEGLATKWNSEEPFNPAWVHDLKMDDMIGRLIQARHDRDIEKYRELFREIDLYAIDQHWIIWGPTVPRIRVTQPWVKGYSGEYHLGRSNTNALFARLWIDRDLKAEMGY